MLNDRKLTIQYLANCAVLIRYREHVILVDGLFSDESDFGCLKEELPQDITCLIATHCHSDHYDQAKVEAVLARGAMAVLPPDAEAEGGRQFRMTGRDGVHRVETDGLTIEFRRTEHLSEPWPEHYCVNVLVGDVSALFTADMAPSEIPGLAEFSRRTHAVCFVNGITLWSGRYRKQLRDLGYEKLFFYHLPGEGEGTDGFRRRTLRFWDKCSREFPEGKLLDGPEVIYEIY